jgi:soluble lytic murein transglycosylase
MRRALLALLVVIAAAGLGTAYVLVSEPAWYLRIRYPLRYEAIIREHARNYDLPPALVAAVIYTESKFDPSTRSRAGAIGLMQLLPATAVGIATRTGGGRFTPNDLYDPEINVRYGCWYLRNLRARYRSRPNAAELALAAYNAGQANVDRWLAQTPAGQPVTIPFAETRAYLHRVRDLEGVYAKAYGLSQRSG